MSALADALVAARLCAIDPLLGGMILRGGSDTVDLVIAQLRAALPDGAPFRRVPSHIDDERLLGGIDLTATLARGAAVSRTGVLVEADGGALIVPMAERLSDATAGRIAAVIDSGAVVTERDGVALRNETRFVLVALDDGVGEEERPPDALTERLAFRIDLTEARPGDAAVVADPVPSGEVGAADAETLEAFAVIADALGVDSARGSLLAVRAARASARLAGRAAIEEADVMLAARLVLGPRATRLPAMPESDQPPAETPPPPPPPTGDGDATDTNSGETGPIEDVVLDAVLASLPRDVLARIASGRGRRSARPHARGAGERRKSNARGRPVGARAGTPGGQKRLSLIDTLRTAAPWQKLRGRDGRILIRRDDLRVRRYESRAETLTIFAVDASGSSAMERLGEAKGAVELLLAEAYVKRAQVALTAFRGTTAELLLPPTRSLARARRVLAALPGGGGTPLAAGLDAARTLAEAARAQGRTPFIVMLTDGRANIAGDGSMVRERAQADALTAATAIGASGIACAFVDTSARPRPEGAAIAAAMGARYLPLPRADAAAMHAAVSAAQRP